ncbi:unnamed protein product [Musa acuminata subsp. malaccensis]|uniref:(wild Malaysian banana) hypothetical protein n=1 Tax=Musa acuminata subsp. malaccensis TaxID=214687 RepID=A0A804KT88_MUSAM|nr:PREDICTED: uncharacterized protein LOC103999890 isoform X1 [Musa acuminata subsp. malaccensis]XP_009420060.1 PREDICTED: uncharacterized protein LOC103999890 isoform X1 [Musa acuminata subsp. malaccensis]XP_009420061.1 PREDICTED: uncharacterized protein LOC103999890 isoform X1 [Musa acuminata subsp. malaccensis]XP_018675450.1 PREDICTED: uncharacterized protein LOC103999890 isoform X1 [Musa acuminata subsp. malaccensis]XP_018675451.1 PREDICTED: uncharacterized protein LOC103999890 isoform X1 [
MLSTKNSPDPSCSSHLPAPRTGESASQTLAFQERNPILEETPTPNFSIRDYVFASRTKGLETSWPFAQHFLRLCFKDGVKGLLPPFEPPNLLRVQCRRKEVEQILAHIVDPQEEKQSCDRKTRTCQEISKDDLAHCDAGVRLIRTHEQVETSSYDIGNQESKTPATDIENKCRLIVKLGVISGSSRTEDTISDSSTVSDPMASKVCPVCRTFSSTSNTTLNAHIDQCLSMESNTKWMSSKLSKPTEKPRKKRLMVDIYATAPRCTLEDLDKRNGTNWANEMAFATAPTVEVDMETKKPKLSPTESTAYVEGSVSVNSAGAKLKILSKFNDMPKLKEGPKFQKHEEVIEPTKMFLVSKKKHLNAKFSRKMKVKAQRNKLSSRTLLKAQIQTAHEGYCNAKTHHENEESLNPGNLNKSSSSLRQLMCSRRSDLPKNLFRKNVKRASDNTVPLTRSRLTSEDLVSSPKRVHSAGDGFEDSEKLSIPTFKWSSESTVKNGILLRKPKSSGNSVASSGIKIKEIDLSIQHQSDNSSRRTNISLEICHRPLIKDPIKLILKKKDSAGRTSSTSEVRKGDLKDKLFSFDKFRKHRSVSRSGKSGVEFQATPYGIDIPRTSNDALESCEFDCSKSVTVSPAGEMMNHGSTSRKDVPGDEERDDRSTMEEQNHGDECHGPDVENLNMQVEVFHSGHCVIKSSKEISTANPSPNDIVSSGNLQASFGARLDPSPLVEQVQYISKREFHEKQLVERSERQEESCDGVSREEIDDQNIQIADEMEERGEKVSCAIEPKEYTVDTMSIQESSGCLTNGDVGPRIPERSTSVTSVRTIVDDAMNLASDGEPSGSPVSTASTLFVPSSIDSKYTDPENEALGIVVNVEDKLALMERNVEGRNQELKANLSAKEPSQSVNDEPFYSSCRESLSRESQSLRSNATQHRTTIGKQVPDLFPGPRISSSFSLYQNPRTNTMVSSTSTETLSDSAVKVPSCTGANPILRLMGKNLMVMKNEEFVPPSTVMDHPPDVNLSSHLGFSSANTHMKQQNFPGTVAEHQFPVCLPSTAVAGFSFTSLHAALVPRPNQQTQEKNAYKKFDSSATPCMMNEVIVIDDSPKTDKQPSLSSPTSTLPFDASSLNPLSQRSFSCLSSQDHIEDPPSGMRPLLPNLYTGVDASLIKRYSTAEGHFMFQSPGTAYMRPSICYSQTLH